MDLLKIRKPDDMHLHLRDGAMLSLVVPHTARQFSRAIVMPNLRNPVVSADIALAYRERILGAIPQGCGFEPLMTLYLTDNTTPEEIDRAVVSKVIKAVKYYPAGATTNSDSGVTDIGKSYAVFEALVRTGMPLLVHGEVTSADIDIFDREKVFIDLVLSPLLEKFPELKVVLEHITTKQAVSFVNLAGENVAATITPHHLILNRNDLFKGGIRPHHYCLPIVKREEHRLALLEAATSGSNKFFLGTDSAPHERMTKESSCGCAGVYSAFSAMQLYAEAFDSVGKLSMLEDFSSAHGANFYGLPVNSETIVLVREEESIPEALVYEDGCLVPFRAGETVKWKVK
jgi:dihydroorotase